MTQSEFEEKWHNKLVRPLGHYKIPDKEYFVTACLLDERKFAIMATDYSPENKHYITFDLGDEELKELENRFEILGDYNPIDFEILFECVGEEELDGEPALRITSKNYSNGVETNNLYPSSMFPDFLIGDKLYDIGWLTTTSQKVRKSFFLRKKDWENSSNDQIIEKFKDMRNFIRGGLYHFFNFEYKSE